MDVEAAEPRRVEHRLRQDQAIGRDHRHIRAMRRQIPPAPRHCFSETGVRTAIPSASARACTGDGVSRLAAARRAAAAG